MKFISPKLLIIAVLILITLGLPIYSLYNFTHRFYTSFLSSANLTHNDIKSLVKQTQSDYLALKNQNPNHLNILILGLDQRSDSLEQTTLTDAIMLGSYHSKNNQLNLLSLPRDLWYDQEKTKINALYYYEHQYNRPNLTIDSIASISGQRIDHYFVLDYTKLPALIDLLGGITVDNPTSFTDNQFPNPDYVNDPKSTTPVYITVNFPAGKTGLDGTKALQFVRSRHSSDTNQGSDLARSGRQMILIRGILDKIASKQTLKDPQLLGKLYRFYKDSILTDLTDSQLISLALHFQPNSIPQINSFSLPTNLDSKEPLLINPPLSKKYQSQWVFIPKDPSFKQIHDYIADKFK